MMNSKAPITWNRLPPGQCNNLKEKEIPKITMAKINGMGDSFDFGSSSSSR